MAKKSKLLNALDRYKGVDYELERQKKMQKQAEKRKRAKRGEMADDVVMGYAKDGSGNGNDETTNGYKIGEGAKEDVSDSFNDANWETETDEDGDDEDDENENEDGREDEIMVWVAAGFGESVIADHSW